MLSSRISSGDEGGEEGESITPRDSEPWSEVVSHVTSRTPVTSQRSTVPPTSRVSSRSPRSTNPPTQPKFWPPDSSPDRSPRNSRSRRRIRTPEISLERQKHHHHRHHHHHHRHRSSEPNRIITIPLDNYPTYGMGGSPRQVLEIERVRCHRRRKHRPRCYKIGYDIPPPPPPTMVPLQPQSNIIYTNPAPPSYLVPVPPPSYLPPSFITPTNTNPPPSWLSTYSNLTPQMIENLPRKIVHLPPIYLPDDQADLDTEFDSVIFPAEIVNPIDGSLSIIQCNSIANSAGTTFAQSPAVIPVQPQFITAPTTTYSPPTMISRASGPFMQQVQDLFQRMTLSPPQIMSSPYNQKITQSVLPQYGTAMNSPYNPQIILPTDTTDIGPYPPANIQPIVSQNSGPYYPTTFTPTYSGNIGPYPPANITPYRSSTNAQYNPVSNGAYQLANIGPYRPANITPYTSLNASSTTNAMRSDPGTFIIPPDTSDIGPYGPANITPYTRRFDQSNDISILTPSIPTPSMPYTGLTPFASSHSPTVNNLSRSIPSIQTPYRSNTTTTTKSILRNGSSNHHSSTTYTRLTSPNILSSNVVTRELATVV